VASVCIVSDEIYPIDKGGIGRLLYNFAVSNAESGSPADLHFLLSAKFRMHAALVEAEFADLATIHYCPDSLEAIGILGKLIEGSGVKDSLDELMITSLRYYVGLTDAQRSCGTDFDIVEFPDFGGWGAASIAAKHAGLAFGVTRFVIRLHSTFDLIARHEPFMHEPSEWMAGLHDLEFQCLRDADLIVSHLHSTAGANADGFALPAEWKNRVRVEMPPILLSKPELAALTAFRAREESASPARNFLFSSRLQPFKRPDIFIRAAVRFLDEDPEADNLFLISSYGWDEQYVDWLKRLVPERWRENVVFLDKSSQQERTELMLQSILVIPSDFESLCLLAYEGRQLGLKLILNQRCAAFGMEPQRWRAGEDCLFFDGNFIDLARVMREALNWTPQPAQPFVSEAPYWESPIHKVFSPDPECAAPLSVAYIVYGAATLRESGVHLQELLFGYRLSDVHVIAPREAFDASSVSADAWTEQGITVHQTSWIEPTAGEIQAVISQLTADAVAFLPTDMRVERALWSLAAKRLAERPDAAVFTSHAVVEHESAARPFGLTYGDAPTVALLSDRVAHRASVFRRAKLLELGLRDQADGRWYEDLCIRLVIAGCRVLVAPLALAAQTSASRRSRLDTARFFSSHRDEAGRHLGTPFRLGSLGRPIDSVVGITHSAWIAQQEQARAALAGSASLAPGDMRFDEVVLKSASAEDNVDYAELEIILHGLDIGGVSISWLGFKLSQYKGQPQLEFRDSLNAQQLFKSWPPPTSDPWGPVAVWAAGPMPHAHGLFFEQATGQDARKLELLLKGLQAIVELLPLTPKEKVRWNEAAHTLLSRYQFQLDGNKAAGSENDRTGNAGSEDQAPASENPRNRLLRLRRFAKRSVDGLFARMVGGRRGHNP
jgi:glycosyltransferase involved in cell wall biosynthesis